MPALRQPHSRDRRLADSLPCCGKENGMTNSHFVHEVNPSLRTGIFESPVRCGRERARRPPRERILNMAVQRKHAAAQTPAGRAKWKMTGNPVAVLENMSVAIDDLDWLIHLSSSAN